MIQNHILILIWFTNRNLAIRLPYIDSKRIAIWGWSYGGYAAAMALANDDAGVFKCAASVAPVTDWTYYGNVLENCFLDLDFLKNTIFSQIPFTPNASWVFQR